MRCVGRAIQSPTGSGSRIGNCSFAVYNVNLAGDLDIFVLDVTNRSGGGASANLAGDADQFVLDMPNLFGSGTTANLAGDADDFVLGVPIYSGLGHTVNLDGDTDCPLCCLDRCSMPLSGAGTAANLAGDADSLVFDTAALSHPCTQSVLYIRDLHFS
jgi:hypothetical protein